MYSCSYQRVAYEGVFMGPTQGPYILQLCMGPSYFWEGLTPPDPPLISHTAVNTESCRYRTVDKATRRQSVTSSTARRRLQWLRYLANADESRF